MIKVLLSSLIIIVLLASCKQDTSTVDGATSAAPQNTEVAVTPSMSQIKGFNFLNACDSLIVSKLVLSGPNGEGDFAYLHGQCVSGKTFDLLLVPRSGATPASEFGDPMQVLAKAAKNDYADYICYAFEMPKQLKLDATGVNQIVNFFPINAVIKRLDNNTWIRLGQDRADDLTAYNTLRWNILHDNMPQYD